MESNSKERQMDELTDEQIIELYWSRNEDAIGATDDKYGKYLYMIAYNIVHDNMDCEECLNDTYLSTWNRIPPTKPNFFQLFLSKIMRNIAVDRYRKNSADKRVSSEMTSSLEELGDCIPNNSALEDEVMMREVIDAMNQYLRELTKREVLIFICRYYYSDSIDSIAKMLKVSRNTVFRDLSKIRAGLKERLEAEGYFHE
ncbi:MAG: sigma-70 family RNA polymerase sigma factor [Clostridia bacterium]|nr:sigma-70 family RNA polymerase sigma factor [Clostridia bacterium]MBQ8382901.1 sigma-70 family RNA polymerase sigma factor [Clostridia bacterium]